MSPVKNLQGFCNCNLPTSNSIPTKTNQKIIAVVVVLSFLGVNDLFCGHCMFWEHGWRKFQCGNVLETLKSVSIQQTGMKYDVTHHSANHRAFSASSPSPDFQIRFKIWKWFFFSRLIIYSWIGSGLLHSEIGFKPSFRWLQVPHCTINLTHSGQVWLILY